MDIKDFYESRIPTSDTKSTGPKRFKTGQVWRYKSDDRTFVYQIGPNAGGRYWKTFAVLAGVDTLDYIYEDSLTADRSELLHEPWSEVLPTGQAVVCPTRGRLNFKAGQVWKVFLDGHASVYMIKGRREADSSYWEVESLAGVQLKCISDRSPWAQWSALVFDAPGESKATFQVDCAEALRQLDELRSELGRVQDEKGRLTKKWETQVETIKELWVERDGLFNTVAKQADKIHGLRNDLNTSETERILFEKELRHLRSAHASQAATIGRYQEERRATDETAKQQAATIERLHRELEEARAAKQEQAVPSPAGRTNSNKHDAAWAYVYAAISSSDVACDELDKESPDYTSARESVKQAISSLEAAEEYLEELEDES